MRFLKNFQHRLRLRLATTPMESSRRVLLSCMAFVLPRKKKHLSSSSAIRLLKSKTYHVEASRGRVFGLNELILLEASERVAYNPYFTPKTGMSSVKRVFRFHYYVTRLRHSEKQRRLKY